MPRELIISAEAEGGLGGISNNRPLKADRFIGQFYLKGIDISELDGIGRHRNDLAGGLLSMPHKRYIIFFERKETHVSIVRILRGSCDLDQIFDEE